MHQAPAGICNSVLKEYEAGTAMNLDPTSLINLKITDYIIIISLNGILTALISWWVQQLIKHKYDKKLSDYGLGVNKQLEDHKLGINKQLEDYKFEINKQLEDHKFGFNTKLEEYKFDIRKREQAAKVVELFSLVRSISQQNSEDIAGHLAAMNCIAWELSLWLPAEIVRGLTNTLKNVEGSKDPKQILIEIRKVLLGSDDNLQAEEIVHFTETEL
jgi:hypothetical protein